MKYIFAIVPLLFCSLAARGQQYQYPFQNPDLPVEERVNNILLLMTVEEKVAALAEKGAETDGRLNSLINVVERHISEGHNGNAQG